MPRGVYKRKGQQAAAVVKAAAPSAVLVAAPAPAAPAVEPDAAPREFTATDFRKPIDDMSGALLRAFARRIGIMQRDVERLTEDRLRQNCKAAQMQAIEDA